MKPKKRLIRKWWSKFGSVKSIRYDSYCLNRISTFLFHTKTFEEDERKINKLYKGGRVWKTI